MSQTPSAIEKALQIAVKAHTGQKDKAGAAYILHPLRLMLRMDSETEMIVAVLHDVVEDTPVTFEELSEAGFSDQIIEALRALTHDPSIDYFEYLRDIKDNPVARKVKLADLEDNMDLRRLNAEITEKDIDRLKKYRKAWQFLSED